MNQLPQTGYLRLYQIIGNTKNNPSISPLIPIGKSSWWAGIKTGRYPKPIKLGPRTTVWRVEDIRDFIQNGSCHHAKKTVARSSVDKKSMEVRDA